MKGGIRSKKNQAKLWIFVFLCMTGVAAATMSARWFGDVTQSEETNEVFNAAAEVNPELLDSVVWEPDQPDLRRKMEPLTRVDVTAAWIRAWEQMSIVAQTGDTTGLEVYFANSALESLLASEPSTQGLPVHQLGHRLRIDFYSQDGQVIGLSAPEVRLLRSVPVGDGIGWVQTVESFEAVLLLEDGNFRVQHWVRRSVEQRLWVEPVTPATDEPSPLLAGVNYYPTDHPFDTFWANYDSDIVAADFDRIQALGANSVRVFLPFDELDGQWVTEEELDPVIDLLDLAATRKLGVVVTLFDGRTDHRPSRWDADRVHIAKVVPVLAEHPALLMWDIKNEPDRDIGANGVDEQVLYAWLTHVAHEVRGHDSATPLTVGWSTPAAALAAPVVTDVVSVHHYGPVEDLEQLAPRINDHSEGRPVLLSEYGLPTYNSIFPGGHTEAEQAAYAARTRQIVDRHNFAGSMVWTLWDLTEAPADAGRLPTSVGPQKTLGVLRVDGSAKPAAAFVGIDSDYDNAPTVWFVNRLQKTFWRMLIVLVLVSIGVRFVYRRYGVLGLPRRAVRQLGGRIRRKKRSN